MSHDTMLAMMNFMSSCESYTILGGVPRIEGDTLKRFLHGSLLSSSLFLVLIRIVPVGERSYMLFLSDGTSAVWALAVNSACMAGQVKSLKTEMQGMLFEVALCKCAAVDGAPFLLCRYVCSVDNEDEIISRMEDEDEDEDDDKLKVTDEDEDKAEQHISLYASFDSSVRSPQQLELKAARDERRAKRAAKADRAADAERADRKAWRYHVLRLARIELDKIPMNLLVARGPGPVLRHQEPGKGRRDTLEVMLGKSMVHDAIRNNYGKGLFTARLCVIGFCELAGLGMSVVLTDGAYTIVVPDGDLPDDVCRFDVLDLKCVTTRPTEGPKYLACKVLHHALHVGSDVLACCRQISRNLLPADNPASVSVVAEWCHRGALRPKEGTLVTSDLIEEALAETLRFTLVEYYTLGMDKVSKDDYVAVQGEYYTATVMPLQKTRAQKTGPMHEIHLTTCEELGRKLYRILDVPEIIEILVSPLLNVRDVANLSAVCKQARQIVLQFASRGRDQFYMLSPANILHAQQVYYLQYQFRHHLQHVLTASTSMTPPEVQAVNGRLPITHVFARFAAENDRCVCGGTEGCLYCITRLDVDRRYKSDFLGDAPRNPSELEARTREELEQLRLRNLNVLIPFPDPQRYAYHNQSFVAQQDTRLFPVIAVATPVLDKAGMLAHIKVVEAWLRTRITRLERAERILCSQTGRTFEPVAWWRLRLQGLYAARPLVPGTIAILLEHASQECARILLDWDRSVQNLNDTVDMLQEVPVTEFSQPRDSLPLSRRVRVQMRGGLFFGARVVYRYSDYGPLGATMIPHENFYTFVASDGEHIIFFSTDCGTFVDLLNHAVTTRELEHDFERNITEGGQDPHAQTETLYTSSALQNYVVEMSVLAVHNTAMLSGDNPADTVGRYVGCQLLCREFTLVDSQRPQIDAVEGHLVAQNLFTEIEEHVRSQTANPVEQQRLEQLVGVLLDTDFMEDAQDFV